MAATGVSSARKTNPRGFMASLSSAVCEWCLIFLLFVDAAFSYLLVKFSQYCELPTPCLFCSRITCSFGKKKHESYRSLLCSNHIEEISSLVSCHIHGNLADIHGMCEDCFMPFSLQNKLNSGSYKLSVGKRESNIERHSVQSLLLNRKLIPSPSGLRICSCCHKSWGESSNAQRLLQLTPVGFGASRANVKPPLPRAPGRSRFSRRDSFRRLRDKLSGPSSPRSVRNSGDDPLSHVGYTELKIHSDSESEVPMSDDDDGGSAMKWKDGLKAKDDVHTWIRRQPNMEADAAAADKESHQAPILVASLLDQPVQLDGGKHKNADSLASDVFSAHGLEELIWDQPHSRGSIQPLPELISLDDVTQAPDVAEALAGASSDISTPIDLVSHVSSLLSEDTLSLNSIPALSNVTRIPENSSSHVKGITPVLAKDSANAIGFSTKATPLMSNDMNAANTSPTVDIDSEVLDKGKDSVNVIEFPTNSTPSISNDFNTTNRSAKVDNDREVLVEPKDSINAIGFSANSTPLMPTEMNRTNTSAGVNNGRHLLDKPLGPLSASDISKVEDMILPPDLYYAANDKLQTDDASSSDGIQNQMLSSLERNYSGPEPLDGVGVSDFEAKCVVDRVKQQIGMNSFPQLHTQPDDKLQRGDASSSNGIQIQMLAFPENDSASEPLDGVGVTESEGENVLGRVKQKTPMKSLPQVYTPANDKSHRGDASSSNGIHIQMLAPPENDSGPRPLDGADVTELEGESVVDRLKQQIDMKSFSEVCTSADDDMQRGDATSSDGNQIQMLASSERNDSGPEPLEGVGATEFEGESAVDRPKQQIDMKSLPEVCTPEDDEFQRGDASSSEGNQIQMLASSERNDSGPDPLDGVGVTEFEGEKSVVDRLKQQINMKSLPEVCTPADDVLQRGDASSSDGNQIQMLASSERNDSGPERLKGVGITEFEGESVLGSLRQQIDVKSSHEMYTSADDNLQRFDSSRSRGNQIQTLASAERSDSGPEPLYGVSVGDFEGESVIDRLKEQRDCDKRCMDALYKELEEERNAASVAADEAMAMINRLQEEKAALHMEALQYLRMMDEQAEHDMEALEKANDLLAEKEKEVQDLEAELEYYRNTIQELEAELEYYKNNFQSQVVHKEISSLMGERTIIGDSSADHAESGPRAATHSESSKITEVDDISNNTNSLVSNFEDEKLYLVQWLKKLERRIHEISGDGACIDTSNGGHSEQKPYKFGNQDDLPTNGEERIYHNKEASGLLMQNGSFALSGRSAEENSIQDCSIVLEENSYVSNNKKKLSSCEGEISLENFENEIANFSDRLRALETDHDFLNHVFGALGNGNDGLQFIQEIVHQLQELRKIKFEKRSLSVS